MTPRLMRRLPGLLLWAFASTTAANMAVDRNILLFEPGEPDSHDVTVTNQGSEPLFIDVQVLEVRNPGSEAETREPVVRDENLPLLVSPEKMALAPGQQRLLRVVNLSGNDAGERVFRITLKPIPAPARAERSGIRVLVAYQLLVIASPSDPRPDLLSRRDGGRLTFENRGNSNVLLHSGRQCPPDKSAEETECALFRGTRLYPGNVWSVETPYQTPVQFMVSEASRTAKRTF